MRKTTFFGNFVAWVAAAAVCIAFLAWYHMSDATAVASAIESSALVQLGVVLASPVLLFAMGVVIGLLLLWFKKILMGRTAKRACRAAGIAGLALLTLVAVPVLAPSTEGAFLGVSVVVVYVTMAAPILIMMLGFLYALGCAGVDASKRGPFAKYLPADERVGRAERAGAEKDERAEHADAEKDGRDA